MPIAILYPEFSYPDESVEREVFGPDATIIAGHGGKLAELSDADCAAADGLMVLANWVSAADIARFPKLRAIVRMGVGYDRIDRAAAATRGIMVCNVPDYGTMEVADHALALALTLRRGILLHHDLQRQTPPAPWTHLRSPMIRRLAGETFGIIGLGRIGIAAALRARGFGFRIVFYDPYVPNGTERALGVERAQTLDDVLAQSDVLSIHAPLTSQTRGMIGRRELALLPWDAVVVNTARGPIIELDALEEALRSGHVAAAGLDVLPVEPPIEPVHPLLQAYRERAPWLEGRLVITPHAAFFSPESWDDIRRKSAETMAAALLTNQPRNVIPPESD